MTLSKSQWQREEVAVSFLEGMRGAIPSADLQMVVIGKIVQQWQPNPRTVLDLGCGDGVLGRYLLSLFPKASGLFVDFSDPMLEAVHQKVANLPTAQVISADFSTTQWIESVDIHGPIDVVVSGFAIHHQPDERKQAIYREIYNLLSPGGVFLNLEHISSRTPAGEALFDEFFIDHLYAFQAKSNPDADREAIAQQYHNRLDKSENILAPVDVQCQWLREIGYCDVDCFFKLFELGLFGGRKDC